MDKQLRLVAGHIVVESKLSKQGKLQMINFIQKEATDTQVKVLLMDGNIVQLDEQAEEIANARFESHSLNEAGLINVINIFLPAWRALAVQFSDAHRQCGIMKISRDRDACLAKARMGYAKKKIEILKKAMSNCSSQKIPAACKKTLLSHISKEEEKYNEQSSKLQAFTMKGRVSGKGPSKFVTARG